MGDPISIVATNRRARRLYQITETIEAGLVLKGTEVKALRGGRASLAESFCRVDRGELFLFNAHIAPYTHGSHNNHDPVRRRKLLVHAREIRRLRKATEQKGFTVIPLKLYFRRGIAKIEIGLARGKRLTDRRADIIERETKRRLDRTLKQY